MICNKVNAILREYGIKIWKRIFTGTVPVNKAYLTGTVAVNKAYLTGTVPVNKTHLKGTPFSELPRSIVLET